MQVCQEALDIHGSLINEEQYLWQEELKGKFRHMQIQLSPLLSLRHKVDNTLLPLTASIRYLLACMFYLTLFSYISLCRR